MQKTQWNTDAQPYDVTLDKVLYDIRCSDGTDGLLLDAVTAQDIIEDADGELTFDALVTPYAKLERRMELLRSIMERTGEKVKPVALQIVGPFKQRGVANVAAVFELSDGQTLTIFFHNPDVTPNKMAPTDEVISWKWLLNKKDVTIVVAPERGADLNIREVARRVIRLAEKNSPAFQRINARRAERMQNIQKLKDEIATLEADLKIVQHELEVAKVAAEDAEQEKKEKGNQENPDTTKENIEKLDEKPAELRGGDIQAPNTEQDPAESPSSGQISFDAYKAALGEATAMLNAAISEVNWDGITNNDSAGEAIFKLRAVQDRCIKEIIGKAAEDLGMAPWDDRLHDVRLNCEEGRAWLAAGEAAETAVNRMRDIGKERLIAKGAEEVAALIKDSKLSDIAYAIFHKAGIDTSERIPPIVTAIENKDVALAWSILSNLDNKASAKIFEHATGIKLAKTQKERRLQIDAWAGITPEKRAEMEAKARKLAENLQARQLRINEMLALETLWKQLGRMRVSDGDTAQDLLKSAAGKGADFDMRKYGAVSRPVVAWHENEVEFSWPKYRKNLRSYLAQIYRFFGLGKKYFGTLEKTLAYFGAQQVNLSGKELGEFPDTEEGKAQLRAAAIERMKAMRDEMQADKGRGMDCPILGGKVFVRGRGIREIERFSGNPDKLKLVGGLREILQNAYAKSWEANYKPETKPGIEGYFTLDCKVTIDGEPVLVKVLVEKDASGSYHYDFLVDRQTEKALDSAWSAADALLFYSEMASRACLEGSPLAIQYSEEEGAGQSVDENKALDSTSALLRPNLILATLLLENGQAHDMPYFGEGQTEKALDSADAGGFVPDAVFDAASGNRMVLNMFIVGEEADDVEIEVEEEKLETPESAIEAQAPLPAEAAPVASHETPVDKTQSGAAMPENAPKMVEALLVTEASPAAQPADFVGPAKDRMAALKVLTDTGMNRWMSEAQSNAVIDGLMGEEWRFFADKMKELAGVIANMPKTYEQNEKGSEAVAYLHYFRGSADWYITERDIEGVGTEQAFGLADLYGDGGELGYISVNELVTAGVELDFHFKPKTIGQIRGGDPVASEEQRKEPADDNPDMSAAQKEADRALFQSVIDGTVPDIFSPELADALEAAFNRSQGDADMVNLFELAVGAYQNAMLAATSNLS